MISMIDLNELWKSIVSLKGLNVGRRVDEAHPLDFFIAYDEQANMQMILLTDIKVEVPESTKQILVRLNMRSDEKYALCFSLVDISLKSQFVILCWDIINCTYNTSTARKGVEVAINRFGMWQKLFAGHSSKLISEAEIKGLMGELYVLNNIILPDYEPYVALSGWGGPLGTDRDFEFANIWYEVKATSLSRDNVTISSLDQLDTDDNGVLAIVRLERGTNNNSDNGWSINKLVKAIDDKLTDMHTRDIFHAKLCLSGYEKEDSCYDEIYLIHNVELYKVNDMFPRLRRSHISAVITNSTYTLSIPGIQAWKFNK